MQLLNYRFLQIVLLVSTSLRGQETARAAFEELKHVTTTSDRSDASLAKIKSAEIIQDAFDNFYFASPADETTVTKMMEHYYGTYNESPFIEFHSAEIEKLDGEIEAVRREIKKTLEKGARFSKEAQELSALKKKSGAEIKKINKLRASYQVVVKEFLSKNHTDKIRKELQRVLKEGRALEREVNQLLEQVEKCSPEQPEAGAPEAAEGFGTAVVH